MNDTNRDDDLEVTNEEEHTEDTELIDEEERSADKLRKYRNTISRLEDEKKHLQDELQRAKAEFLNAKRRLEEEKKQGIERRTIRHIEALLPLCDSFAMAMNNTEVWEKADEQWRKGVEGIRAQLQQILDAHHVTTIDPTGAQFDPNQHEAVGTEPVDTPQVDTIVSVIQHGYQITQDNKTDIIRPARVTIGVLQTEK